MLLGTDETPVAGEDVVVIDSTGKEFQTVSDASGKVRIEGLAAGAAKIDLRGRNGGEWTVEEAS